eukprot:101451_1
MASLSSQSLHMEQISPLCVRIKNAFSKNEIKIIHSTYQSGIQPIMCINPTSKLKVKFDKKYIECEALGSFKIYNDENDEKDEKKGEDKEDLVQINICESEYTKKHGIANVNCFIPTNRIDENDLRRNHSRILCKTESRNFGVLSGDTVNGHIVTYLDSIFSIYAKHIYSKMMNYCKYVDKNMKWELLNNDSYQTKCIEYIQYQKQNDNLGWHCDLGSLVTIVIMLANSNEYEGANL